MCCDWLTALSLFRKCHAPYLNPKLQHYYFLQHYYYYYQAMSFFVFK